MREQIEEALGHAASTCDKGVASWKLGTRSTPSPQRVADTRRMILAFLEGIDDETTVAEIVAELVEGTS